ncbi:MAG: hypothetical protein EBY50_09840 [Rhodobacteraceae bacterium]|nr:hypothetical protein [Paracoccaceae bacterium]
MNHPKRSALVGKGDFVRLLYLWIVASTTLSKSKTYQLEMTTLFSGGLYIGTRTKTKSSEDAHNFAGQPQAKGESR